ncbi:hypothetical protein QEO76_gp47 [Arthrobacter phage Cole]|uniref:Uncharacterized protein n=1 Tax=Arthrobacter phage Cole TaxID=2944951 RepID=A0A9E7E5L2_9CAUD|nr:hypothetical protein QEO76_gp47 [Arthrobacter phage Cole]URC18090.1 hypothetical protein SEA_COLE_53 [Arthrobacter phage Cole]
MTTIFDARQKPIQLPDTPRISRSDADIMHYAGLSLPEWEALTDQERADIRWNAGVNR